MPRSAYFTKEMIVDKALQLIEEKGPDALSARSLGKALGCSISPIFTVFENMEEVCDAVHKAAQKILQDYIADVTDYIPAFKEFGLRMIRFAREEKNLFHYLFLQNGVSSAALVHPMAMECLRDICSVNGITPDQAETLFQQMWVFTAGLAMFSAKEPGFYTDEVVSEMLSFNFGSALHFLRSGEPLVNPVPRVREEGEPASMKI